MQADHHLWQLSIEDLAKKCHELAQDDSGTVDPGLRDEARRIDAGWTDAFSIDGHANDAQERIAAATASLRNRTIELLLKAEQEAG